MAVLTSLLIACQRPDWPYRHYFYLLRTV